MKVVAISRKGEEFLYQYKTAHKVPKTKAEEYCKVLNDIRYNLKDGEVWAIHDVDRYDRAYGYAEEQEFCKRNGGLVRKAYHF